MKGIITAFSDCDSIKIFRLIDTTFYFSIQGKDKLTKIRNRLCDGLSSKRSIENDAFIFEEPVSSTSKYTITLPITEDKYDSVRLIFNFNKDVYQVVYYFDIEWHSKESNEGTILIAPSKK